VGLVPINDLGIIQEEGIIMVELPKTEAELQALLDAKANEITDSLTAKHNSDMANMRKKHESELAKAKEQANMTAEQLAEQRYREQQEADQKELADLRAYKKQGEITQKLEKEGLPSFFKNDTRLLNAEAGDYDKVIKEIKKEYEAILPKGASTSTVVQTSTQGGKPQQTPQDLAFEKMGEAIAEALGKK